MRLLLDTNLLIKLCHPRRYVDVEQWLESWVTYGERAGNVEIFIPAPADYEMRRGYVLALGKSPQRLDTRIALARLDDFCETLTVLQVTESMWRHAAELWAQARLGGYQSAPDHHIDWDVIIASQALDLGAVVVTSNARHFTCYGAEARDWPEITPPAD